MPPTPREELKAALTKFVENEVLGSGEAVGTQMERVEPIIEGRAEQLIQNFEDTVLTERVKALIVQDVRAELTHTRRLDKVIDIGIGIASAVLGLSTTVSSLTLKANLTVLSFKGINITVFWLSVSSVLLSVTLIILFTLRKFRR